MFLYTYDVDREEIFKRAMEEISRNSYDMIGCIHGINGTYMLLSHIEADTVFTSSQYDCAIKAFLTGSDFNSLQSEKAMLHTVIRELANKKTYSVEFTKKDDTGILRSKQLRFSYIDEETKTILFTVNDFTDVVNQERAQQELLQMALDAAKQADAAKSEFMSRMSHDMRTPMNGIIGLTSLALDLPKLTPDVLEYLYGIKSSSQYLLSLINDVLDMSKIESNKLVLNPQPTNAKRLVDDIVASMRTQLDEKQITLDLQLRNTEFGYVLVERVRLQQIFTNILSNAVKFTPAGGKIEWLIECLNFENGILHDRIVIRDNGIGMSSEFLPKLFEPFEQEQNDVTTPHTGTGLGMSIVKNLVEAMGGSIEVKSEKGVGTEITIYLDFERVEEVDSESSIMKPSAVDLTGKHILICEDHPLNMQIASKLLEKKGMVVTPAQNGQEGVGAFLQSPLSFFDAILMDVRMPVMDGLDASIAIRQLERLDAKTIPIIAMTANAYDEDRKKTQQAGMNAHLAKPFEPQELYQTLIDLIDQKENLSRVSKERN